MTKPHTPQPPKKNGSTGLTGLPAGCSMVSWVNQSGERENRIRVRVNRKNLKINKLVSNLEEAEALLGITKKATINIKTKLPEEIAENVRSLITAELGLRLKAYVKNKFSNRTREQDKRQLVAELSRVKTISQTKIFVEENETELGEFSVYEVKRKHLLAYCEARDKPGTAQSTIKRELSLLQGFYKHLVNHSSSVDLFEQSPFFSFSYKFKFAYEVKEKERITEEQEEALFQELMKNEKMLDIAKVALYTGMRKSEILFLRQEQIKDDRIILSKTDTKSKKARVVLLTDEVKAILDKYPSKRLFNYTIDGFNANWKRMVSKAGMASLNFHNLRLEFISRILALDLNQIQKQHLAGIRSYKYFEKEYIDKQAQENVITAEEVAKQVGHASLEITSSTYTKTK